MEKQISRKEIYDGKIIHVVCDEVELDDGTKSKREVVYHHGGACIALKDSRDNKYYMVKQYRYSLEKDMLEFCAGKIEKGENPDEAILREAMEEVGYEAINVRKLGTIIPTCGYCSEKIHLYYGETGKEVGQHLDDNERIDLYKYTFKEIKDMIKSGEIDDAKTISLMYYVEMAGLDA
ncbi:MAG: NUDIX hydrolase [Erysipelotrichaceae bacterium]|nr:NUDIX hydrolase [Erysipelotrichaceae bacterium]